jgi:hypothetical protein
MSSIALNERGDTELTSTLNWALRIWALFYLSAQVLTSGLTPGLRGAFVGAGALIHRTLLLGNGLSQFCALLSLFLLVSLALRTVTSGRSPILGGLAAFLSAVPTTVLYHAGRGELPSKVTFFAAITASMIGLLCAIHSRTLPIFRALLSLCALSLFANTWGYFLLEHDAPLALTRGVAGLRVALAGAALLMLYLNCVRTRPAWLGAVLLIFGFLPAGAAHTVQSGVAASRTVSLVGRTVNELGGTPGDFAQAYAFCLALLMALFAAVSPRSALPVVCASLLVLSAFSAVTPASAAAVALCSYALVVLPHLRHSTNAPITTTR